MQQNAWIDFVVPSRLHFERDSLFKIGAYLARFGSRALLVNIRKDQKNQEELTLLKNGLTKHLDGCILFDDLYGIPDTEQIDSAAYFTKKSNANLIVAFGGLDTINSAKAIAILASNNTFAADLLAGKSEAKEPALPLVTIPMEITLGEELTPYFTILDANSGTRKFYEHESIHPVATFYDTKVCSHLTSDMAASMGGAMLVYAIESILRPKVNPIANTLILKALDTIKKNLPGFYRQPQEEKLLTGLMWASAMTGVSLITNRLGVCWSLATAITAYTDIDFYYALCIVLPHVMEYYLTATPGQFVNIAKSLDEDVKDISVIEAAIKAVEAVRKLFMEVNLPTRLSDFNISKAVISDIASATVQFTQMKNSPRPLDQNEVETLLLAAY
ncbi:MAG: iron-containing alcohol dehydrogenase [Candidatus Hydrogenedentota bacterium]|nr:MAG: iron-containing alcohol dehydrogenase [Candidatus Hydrogenedentota bacterium]